MWLICFDTLLARPVECTVPFWVCWAMILAQFGSKYGNCKCQLIIFNVFYSVSVDLKSHNWYAYDSFYLTDPSFLFY